MDILIKNMEMPKDDALSVVIYSDGVVEVQIGWNGDIPVYSNAFKATAILVPEHGDLIDRDETIEAVRSVKDPSGTRTALLVSRIKRIPSVVEGGVSTSEGEETR